MLSTKKTIGAFSASTLVVGGMLFAPFVGAQGRSAAPSRSQQEVQSALAEQTRNLADQYANRRFGTEASPVVEEEAPAAVQEDFERALRNRTERISRTQPSTANVQMVAPPTASVESRMVAEAMPSLSSSGFGLSTMAVALGITGALRGRRKLATAL